MLNTLVIINEVRFVIGLWSKCRRLMMLKKVCPYCTSILPPSPRRTVTQHRKSEIVCLFFPCGFCATCPSQSRRDSHSHNQSNNRRRAENTKNTGIKMKPVFCLLPVLLSFFFLGKKIILIKPYLCYLLIACAHI